MKKLIVIIVVLIVILIGMIGYKNIKIKENNNNTNIQEIEQIEKYLTKIYMWKEVAKEALPTFEDINEADEMWLWSVIEKNIEDYEISYEQIQNKAKELFGNNFTKEFPKEGTENLTYNKETQKYYASGIILDQLEDSFLLNEINKMQDVFEVEIIEYLEDYSQISQSGEKIIIKNLEDEVIGEVRESEGETKIQEIVRNNKDRFSKKKVYLKHSKEDELIIQKVVK